MNQVLKYPGSKWRIADWIIDNMPEHHSYVEPFFGSGAVFFTKAPSAIETINDIDSRIFNLFKVIRDQPEELAKVVQFTPYSREEYDKSFNEFENCETIESCRKFLIQCWQGHGFRVNGRKVGWKNDVQGREDAYATKNWYRLPDWVMQITDRLKQVQIENRPAIELIKRFNYPNVLLYIDPPYVMGARSGKQYLHEMSDQDHVELIEVLTQHRGKVIISGYNNTIYDSMLKGWRKASINSNSEYYQGGNKTEVIWMNYQVDDNQIRMSI